MTLVEKNYGILTYPKICVEIYKLFVKRGKKQIVQQNHSQKNKTRKRHCNI